MLVNVNKSKLVEEDVAHSVDLPILFATQGWQFSNLSENDPKFVEPQQGFNTVCNRLSDANKSIVWSTDGGSYAKNPRIYFIKDTLDNDRAYLCEHFMSSVENIVFGSPSLEVDMGFYGGKYCSESSKCTLQKKGDVYELTHYVNLVPDNGCDPDVVAITYTISKHLWIQDVTVFGTCSNVIDVSNILSKSKEISFKLMHDMRSILLMWNVYEDKLGVSSPYLELVRTASEFTMGNDTVRQVGIRYMDPDDCCNRYVCVSTMCEETGFKLDGRDLKGSTAICFTV